MHPKGVINLLEDVAATTDYGADAGTVNGGELTAVWHEHILKALAPHATRLGLGLHGVEVVFP